MLWESQHIIKSSHACHPGWTTSALLHAGKVSLICKRMTVNHTYSQEKDDHLDRDANGTVMQIQSKTWLIIFLVLCTTRLGAVEGYSAS